MTTSGSYRLTVDFNDIAEEALDLLQVGQDGETLGGDSMERARKTANFMIKAWQGQGIHLWTMQEGTLFTVKSQAQYDFSNANLANTWYETTISATEAAGQTILSCTDTTNMSATNIIGIVLDSKITHWSTILSKTSTTVTIAAGLPTIATTGAKVRFYAVSSFIPVERILAVRRRESSTYEIPIAFESRADYFQFPDKSSTGSPIQAYFSRQKDPGIMYLWPTPSTSEYVINFTYERPIQIINLGTDTFDIPDYWMEAFIHNLAVRLIPKFGCSQGRAAILQQFAKDSLDLALSFDTDLYPIRLVTHRG
jgi:hypothetical protein